MAAMATLIFADGEVNRMGCFSKGLGAVNY
jgi:molybdopterin-guanine dinucleotide biosynthesis protein A